MRGKRGNVCMTARTAVKEHAKLVHVLRRGTKQEREDEAKEQGRELVAYRRKGRSKSRRSSRH